MKEKIISFFCKDQLNKSTDKILHLRKRIIKSNSKLINLFRIRKYNIMCRKLNCFIPLSCKIGENVCFPHGLSGIFISSNGVIGDNCVIFHQVTIGSNMLGDNNSKLGAPIIGTNCYIGAGAKIIGKIAIGNNVRIGANAIVVKDCPSNSTVVLNHSRVIEHKEIKDNKFIEINHIDK